MVDSVHVWRGDLVAGPHSLSTGCGGRLVIPLRALEGWARFDGDGDTVIFAASQDQLSNVAVASSAMAALYLIVVVSVLRAEGQRLSTPGALQLPDSLDDFIGDNKNAKTILTVLLFDASASGLAASMSAVFLTDGVETDWEMTRNISLLCFTALGTVLTVWLLLATDLSLRCLLRFVEATLIIAIGMLLPTNPNPKLVQKHVCT